MGRRRVVIVGFPGVQSLDVCGPFEVFAAAGAYQVEVTAPCEGVFSAESELGLWADTALPDLRGPIDTLIIAGGDGVFAWCDDQNFVTGVRRAAGRARRLGSICSGAFVLAAAGLLDGRRATTHWRHSERLSRDYPSVAVDSDLIYVQDGDVYTSAGVTAGMDLALALVEQDCGHSVAMAIARELVLFLRRPGGQSQFSTVLQAQSTDQEPLHELQAWIADNLGRSLSVDNLAARMHISPRQFARVFAREVGITPAQYVERVRVEAAQRRLEESRDSVDEIATQCGFGSSNSMRRVFLRVLGVAPSDYRLRFSSTL